MAALHRAFLEEEGLRVGGIAGTLREAWAFLEENPDLVLLDLYLPDGHGLELLPALEGVYTVVITAARDVPTVERALLGGAMDYLVKPFGRSRLREALARFRAFQNLKAKKEVSQADVDRLLGRRQAPKGLDPLTLGRVLALLQGESPSRPRRWRRPWAFPGSRPGATWRPSGGRGGCGPNRGMEGREGPPGPTAWNPTDTTPCRPAPTRNPGKRSPGQPGAENRKRA